MITRTETKIANGLWHLAIDAYESTYAFVLIGCIMILVKAS